jgi:hypothetical protein
VLLYGPNDKRTQNGNMNVIAIVIKEKTRPMIAKIRKQYVKLTFFSSTTTSNRSDDVVDAANPFEPDELD